MLYALASWEAVLQNMLAIPFTRFFEEFADDYTACRSTSCSVSFSEILDDLLQLILATETAGPCLSVCCLSV